MIENIYKRRSVRTFKKTALKKKDLNTILQILKDTEPKEGPFKQRVKFFIIEDTFTTEEEKLKIGTYGFIKNPQGFIGGKIENTFENLIDFGYLFEEIILKLTNINIGTVWLGGTFKRKQFSHLIEKDEFIPAISPIGYINDKQSLRERLIRKKAKANQRKPFKELFFDQSTKMPLDKKHILSHLLELVQVAPSASNKQPWRITVDDQGVHFFLHRTKNYATILPYDIQALDIGIAIKHFEIGLIEEKIPFQMIQYNPPIIFNEDDYIISFRLERTTK